jgi:serralysin
MAFAGVRPVSTGSPYLDGLLSGRQWLSPTLTYGFPTQAEYYGEHYGNGEPGNDFASVANPTMEAFRSLVHGPAALTPVSGFSLLSFTEIAPGPGAAPPDILIGRSSMPATAYAYYPSDDACGGDVWLGLNYDFSNPKAGSYAAATALHEFGHALGLKHPHDTGDPDSAATVPADRDFLEYTVMSYRSAQGGSLEGAYTNEASGFPQTYMMLDILAIQTLYGPNYAYRAGNTTYAWNPLTGEATVDGVGQGLPAANRVFCTIWDGDGHDTYDFSQYRTALSIDLQPGGHTVLSEEQRVQLSADAEAAGNVYNSLLFQDDSRSLIEDAVGGRADDIIAGNAAANALFGRGGDDTLNAGTGDDRLFGGSGADRLVGGAGRDRLAGGSGCDILTGGSEQDVFVFDVRPVRSNRDRISDFSVRDDTIWLDNAVFATVSKSHDATPGSLRKSFFAIGSKAKDSNDHVIYDRKAGILFYDSDGTGPDAAVQIATLTKKLKLTAADFLIV